MEVFIRPRTCVPAQPVPTAANSLLFITEKNVTETIMLVAPLSVIIGCLYWVMSLGKEQAKLNAEIWAKHGK